MAPGMIYGINVAGDKNEFDPLLWKKDGSNGSNGSNATYGAYESGQKGKFTTDPRLPDRHPDTGIDVLIVGAGMGGLMAALECWRKGHNIVGILERSDGPVYSGNYLPLLIYRLYFGG